MVSLLLAVIYLAFVSLGLPDSLLGAAWPVMQTQLGVPMAGAGVLSMIISCGTVVSSLLTGRLLRRLGTGMLVFGSVLLTAVALFGFSISGSLWMLCLFAVPYGLGAGAVDAALNHYVAIHYAARHMSWLHCFWGVGCAVSPYIMSRALTHNNDWQLGYRTVSLLQFCLTALLLLSLPLWKRSADANETDTAADPVQNVLRAPGVWCALASFFCYCGLECTAGLWASSYLVQIRQVEPQTAARFASLFYIGITAGRFLSGFVTGALGDKRMLRLGSGGILLGVILLLLPLPKVFALAGLVIVGLGAAPIYPCQIHATPDRFGTARSQSLIGLQMASAYIGTTLMPPLFGLLAEHTGLGLFPWVLALFIVLMTAVTEHLNHLLERKETTV